MIIKLELQKHMVNDSKHDRNTVINNLSFNFRILFIITMLATLYGSI